MTKRCFSSRQLYSLRNDINVQMLIEKTLRIPCRVTEGCFRFLCPLCSGFDTAVNPDTNLARCFRCEKNFNTIDLVMLIRPADFVQSVRFLQALHQKDALCQDHDAPSTRSASDHQVGYQLKRQAPSSKSDTRRPCRIGNVLGSLLPAEKCGGLEKPSDENKLNKPLSDCRKTDQDRIVKLEQQLEYLGCQIEKIARMVNAGIPSK